MTCFFIIINILINYDNVIARAATITPLGPIISKRQQDCWIFLSSGSKHLEIELNQTDHLVAHGVEEF